MSTLRTAIQHINHHGALLVFPLQNRPEPNSLWKCFYPRSKMRWEWDSGADNRVPTLWHLREELSRSEKVIYSKWYQGRATLFSFRLFAALLSHVSKLPDPRIGFSDEARALLRALEDDSPLPTKQLRESAGLEGRSNEAAFARGMRQLWTRLLIVGYGEIEEGGFPSLAVGSTKLLFESIWEKSLHVSDHERDQTISKYFKPGTAFEKAYLRWKRALNAAQESVAQQPKPFFVQSPLVS